MFQIKIRLFFVQEIWLKVIFKVNKYLEFRAKFGSI